MIRLFDIVFALAGILVFSVAFIMTPLLIVFEDGPPVFFRQVRLGKNRKRITVMKFRTMRNGNNTKVGGLLRASGIDEIPQFLSVLKGHMAMVGPRPLTQDDVTRLNWSCEKFDDRWSIKPGVTGLAQIYGGHSARVSLFLDRRYLRRKGICLNIYIILISFGMNIFGKRRVRNWLRGR